MKQNFQTAIGLMSGTSMDGIDAALVHIDDDFNFEFVKGYSLDYPEHVRQKLLQIADNRGCSEDICFMDFVTGRLFAKCANELIKSAGLTSKNIDFIASHGQTVFHIPEDRQIDGISTKSTLQIGNISVIAQLTGVTTVGDFRSKDIACGGQGAPLVPFADELIFKKDKNRAIQNIGGIGNVTVLSKSCNTFAFDTGPGNMLIDGAVQKLFNLPYDKDGQIAARGKIDEQFLNFLLQEEYYKKSPPKSTGRELFNSGYLQNILQNEKAPQNKYDTVATLTALSAKTIAQAYKNFVLPKTCIDEIVLGGGGAFNKTLKDFIKDYTKLPVKTHEDFGIDNKFKEAIAFALLGFCTMNRTTNNLPDCTGAEKRVIMGTVAYI